MARINAKILLFVNKKENSRTEGTPSFMFSFELSKTLCIEFIKTRNVNGLNRTILDKMNMVTGKKPETIN